VMYANGQGVQQDYRQAAAWYRKAADQGNASAQNNLGVKYFNGQGVQQDYKEAALWYLKAAEQGNATAQGNLGLMYSKGQGVPYDLVLAHKWLNLAAGAGDSNAVEGKRIIEASMTPKQIEKAQSLAREWGAQTSAQPVKPSGSKNMIDVGSGDGRPAEQGDAAKSAPVKVTGAGGS